MEFLLLSVGPDHFSFKGMLGGIFQFYSNCNRTFPKQIVDILIRRRVLDLHCLSMSHKKNARLREKLKPFHVYFAKWSNFGFDWKFIFALFLGQHFPNCKSMCTYLQGNNNVDRIL